MKLLVCRRCRDVIKVQAVAMTVCSCKYTWGQMESDGLTMTACATAVVLDLDNVQLAQVIARYRDDIAKDAMPDALAPSPYQLGLCIVPLNAPSVKRAKVTVP